MFCLSDSFVMLSLKEISSIFLVYLFFIAQSSSLCRLLHSVYGTAGQTQKHDQCSHLGKTIDALIIGDSF